MIPSTMSANAMFAWRSGSLKSLTEDAEPTRWS
jgi:hypothetical protein